MGHGLHIFPSIRAALCAGYEVYDRHPDEEGHARVRIKIQREWHQALARVSREDGTERITEGAIYGTA